MHQAYGVFVKMIKDVHPKVSPKLDPWQQEQYSKHFYFTDEYDSAEDKNVEKFMLDTIYDEEYQKKMDLWTQKDYLEFRDELIKKIIRYCLFSSNNR